MRDVRMKGFAERADVEEVESWLARHAHVLDAERVPLLACAGRLLAEDIHAGFAVPGFPRSAMDGYAVRGEDTFGAGEYDPIVLDVLGVSLPGAPFDGQVGAGQAVRIMTGAPVPEGADAVVMAEVCGERDGCLEVRDSVALQEELKTEGLGPTVERWQG